MSPPPTPPARLAVFLSGTGRTLENLLDRCADGTLPASIELVLASGECPGAERARGRVPAVEIRPGSIPAPELESLLRHHRIDWVLLAGYLRLLPIPPAYRGRILNIHPSLLPLHGGKGMHGVRVHQAVLAAGDRESGCTVHFCDDTFDTGQVILQARCPVLPGDTPDTLAARVFELEQDAYPRALRQILGNPPPRPGV